MTREESDDFWQGRRVFVTGHTGFKGSWLTLVLRDLGARVSGYALAPPSVPSLFALARLHELVESREADVRDLPRLRAALDAARPEIVFHLAAQALVVPSYEDPVATFETNVMGTVNLLEAARTTPGVRAVVIVTSDKCYEVREGAARYREGDPLGGRDPYSASKACAELVTTAYRTLASAGPRLASVRAGNALGGGDWGSDRLVPDLIRAIEAGKPAIVRNPSSIRPWQHVLEPIAGYLKVARELHAERPGAEGAWNFGPGQGSERPVSELATEFCAIWGADAAFRHEAVGLPERETRTLQLDATKARALGWAPRLDYRATLGWTVEWYRAVASGADARDVTLDQIRRHREAAAA